MTFPIDPGRPPGIQPFKDFVPDQGNVDPRAMFVNLEDMLPLRQAFNLDQDDAVLEGDNDQLREQVMSPREHGQQEQQVQCKIGHRHSLPDRPRWSQNTRDKRTEDTMMEGIFSSSRGISSNRSFSNSNIHLNWK